MSYLPPLLLVYDTKSASQGVFYSDEETFPTLPLLVRVPLRLPAARGRTAIFLIFLIFLISNLKNYHQPDLV